MRMKGKHLLAHYFHRALALAAIVTATAGTVKAQTNIITDFTSTSGFTKTTEIDWSYQTLQVKVDISKQSNAFNILNIGTVGDNQEDDGKAKTSNGAVVHLYYYTNDKHLDVRFCTYTDDQNYSNTDYTLSGHGNILYITFNKKNGLTLTDGNGKTVATYAYSSYAKYFDKITANTTFDVSANTNSTNTVYEYARLKGVTVASTPDNLGMYAVTGWTDTAEDINDVLADATKPAFDLTALTCPFTVTPANKNAIVVVGGTITQAGVPTPYKSEWKGTTNLVVIDDAKERMAAVGRINLIDDSNYYPVYTGHAIITTTNSGGFTYTRTVEMSTATYGNAKCFSLCLPMELKTIPEGVTVWAFNAEKSSGTHVVFNNVSSVQANTPYFAETTKNVTISASVESGMLDMTAPKTISGTSTTATPLVLHGNYGVVAGNGTQYALQNTYTTNGKLISFKKFNAGSTIDAFRAYITSANSSDADDLSAYTLSFDEATAIRDIRNESSAATDIYTVDGRRTGATSLQSLPHGLYIQGGKKVVVK